MKITLAINQRHSMELNDSELADLIGFFNDNPSSSDFYNELSTHPASQIRAEVAGKTCLPLATLEKLAADSSIEVVMKVAGNKAAMKSFNAEKILDMARRDVSIALEIARYQMPFIQPFISQEVIEELLQHSDPAVRDAFNIDECEIE